MPFCDGSDLLCLRDAFSLGLQICRGENKNGCHLQIFQTGGSKAKEDLKNEKKIRSLHRIRDCDFDTFPNYVVRLISKNEKIGLVLLEEFIQGKGLNDYLRKSIYERDVVSEGRALGSLEI
jgi:hypothetical protein